MTGAKLPGTSLFREYVLPIGPLHVAVLLDETLAHQAPDTWPTRADDDSPVRLHLTTHAEPFRGSSQVFGDTQPVLRSSCCVIERSPSSAQLSGQAFPDTPSLQRALRFASQPALLDRGWLLFHAATVRLSDGVHLFTAASGTGKTTLATRLERAGGELFGDEVALVGEGRAAVHPGQTTHGTLGRTAPMKAVHVLRRGEPRSVPLSRSQAVRELLGAAMVYEDGASVAARVLSLVTALVADVACFETFVPNDDDAVRLFGLTPGGSAQPC